MNSICVSYIGGRVGSSLTMSLLHKSGVDCGNDLRKPDQFNPSGYFESDKVYNIQYNFYRWMQSFMPVLPDWSYQPELNYDKAKNEILSCYSDDTIAIKTPFAIPINIVPGDIKHIYVVRDHNEQAESLIEVNAMKASKKEWIKWLQRWDSWIRSNYNFYEVIEFRDLMENPYAVYERLLTLDLPNELTRDEVEQTINKGQSSFYERVG